MMKEYRPLVRRRIAQSGLIFLVVGVFSHAWVAAAQPVPVEYEDEPPVVAAPRKKTVRAEAPAAKPDSAGAEIRPRPATPVSDGLARGIVHITDGTDAIGDRWRKRLTFLETRDSKRASEQLAEIERLQKTLAFENLFSVSTALILEARELLASGNSSEALSACRTATRLSPDLPAAHGCVMSVLMASSPTSVAAIFAAYKDEVAAQYRDLRSRRNLLTDEAVTLVLAIVIACALWVLLLILRYAGLFFHDFHHLFPRGVSRWQSVVVAVVLVALPALLGLGILGSVAAAAVAVSFFLSRGEAIGLGVAFALLAASQFVLAVVVQGAALGATAHDVYRLERGEGSFAALAHLQQRYTDGSGDAAATFALGHHYKRIGRYAEAVKYYEAALELEPRSAETLNNLANVYFLQGKTEKAIPLYRQANAANPGLAEPLYNLAKMYFREGNLTQGEEAQKAAIALGGHRVADRIGMQDDQRANLFVLDLSLPDAAIDAIARREAESIQAFGGPVLKNVAGATGSSSAAAVALVPVFVVLLAALLQRRLRPATKCEKCGRAVCTRCDPELTATSGLCGQCISVFVRRTGVDPPDRVRKETSVRNYRRRVVILRRAVGVFIGGGGQVLAGRLVAGTLYLGLFSILISQAVFWDGFLPSPIALPSTFSPVRAGGYALAILALYVVSVRHLMRSESRE